MACEDIPVLQVQSKCVVQCSTSSTYYVTAGLPNILVCHKALPVHAGPDRSAASFLFKLWKRVLHS